MDQRRNQPSYVPIISALVGDSHGSFCAFRLHTHEFTEPGSAHYDQKVKICPHIELDRKSYAAQAVRKTLCCIAGLVSHAASPSINHTFTLQVCRSLSVQLVFEQDHVSSFASSTPYVVLETVRS